MNRMTDTNGRPLRNLVRVWEIAKAKAERAALPFNVVERVAREEAQRRLSAQKMTGKPRISIHPFRNGNGHWYTATAGVCSIRCKSWYQLMYRMAYGRWDTKRGGYKPYTRKEGA